MKKKIKISNIKSLIPKNISLEKIKINPTDLIKNTKGKIESYYTNLKKERDKEKKRLDKKRKLDEKKECDAVGIGCFICS